VKSSDPIASAADRLRQCFGAAPGGAVVLGSGLAGLQGRLTNAVSESYGALGLPLPTNPNHPGRVCVGELAGHRVALLAGRLHVYEGHPLEDVVLPVRALAAWGVRGLVLTSAVGGVHPGLRPGCLVRVTDHLNFMGRNPLVGPNLDALGTRFPDLSNAYDAERGAEADRLAEALGIALTRGVYAAMLGPSYETPAEIRMLRVVGADVVGMSMVPEVIAAVHAGLRVVAFGVVSNLAAGLSGAPLSDDEVKVVAEAAGPRLMALVTELMKTW
jgi:purine-nucleoside phosphorylase